MQRRLTGSLAAALSLAGAVLGLGIALLSAWADYEGLSYFATGASYDRFGGLECPVLLSSRETGTVSAVFDNRGSRPIEQYYKLEVSGPVMSRRVEGQVLVAPAAGRQVAWPIGSQDIALGSFILVKLEVLPLPGFRTRQATCGVLTLPLAGLTGQAALYLGLIGFGILTLMGAALSSSTAEASHDQHLVGHGDVRRGLLLRTLGVIAALAVLAGISGIWPAAVALCAIDLILLTITARYLSN